MKQKNKSIIQWSGVTGTPWPGCKQCGIIGQQMARYGGSGARADGAWSGHPGPSPELHLRFVPGTMGREKFLKCEWSGKYYS